MTNKSDDNKLSFWQFIKTLPIIIKEHPWEFIKEFLIERLRHAAIHAVGAAIGLIGMAVLFFWAVISSDTDSAPSGCSNTEVEKAYFRRIDENKIVSDLQNTTLFVTGGYANLEEKTIYCDVTIKSRSLESVREH